MKGSSKITARQQRFVEEYLIDLNATQAAIRAGYLQKNADNIGSQLLGKTGVKITIAKAKNKRKQRVEITQDYILSNFVEIVERSMQRAPVTNAKGEQLQDETGANLWSFDAKNVNRALELLGKHLGIFKEKVDLTSSDGSMSPLPQAIKVVFVDAANGKPKK